ncbi:MAG: leucine--tRNA ligase, partial [Chloroflexi bacterium]|nr:leucine--tRNA ligase [Chloroflexota bacterium]
WNQWFFLKLYEQGLAYRAPGPANWCPHCATVLANEQVINGRCERCDTLVIRRYLEQWFLRITAYADELLDNSQIDWPERVLTMQRNWIGRSEGVEIVFQSEAGDPIPVFTTRADTIYGVTFMVLAPEHPLVEKLTIPDRRGEVQRYIEMAQHETEIERLSTEKEKGGVFIGAYAINPLNNERVPIWIADYVLLTYGTGAVMGVPAHDSRDFAFAKRFGLPIRVVVAPPGWREGQELEQAYIDPGTMVHSGPFDGTPSEEGIQRIADYVEQQGVGQRKVQYRLRDWLISRQRYWGTPIPVVYCDHCGIVPVPEDELPILLPEDAEFRPTGESPLKLARQFVETNCPQCHAPAHRETDTMDTFVDSSWYFLRYCSPNEDQRPFDPEKVKAWMPVDQYMGGVEHAVMHLLYARFFARALRDLGLIDSSEPFLRLYNQGIITSNGAKMSKSRGNVINPDDYVERIGADVVRGYLMFLGPWDQGGDWSPRGINGIARFYQRVWDFYGEERERPSTAEVSLDTTDDELTRLTHRTVKRVTDDLEHFRFNTALAALMEFHNSLTKASAQARGGKAWRQATETFLLLLAPLAPHLAEELWSQLGLPYSIHNQPWPTWDEAQIAESLVTLVIQVDGRVRDQVPAAASLDQQGATSLAMASERVQRHLGERRVERVVYVPGRLINLVTSDSRG